jgi:hypothetical protein
MRKHLRSTGRKGSLAEINDTPKAAVPGAGIEGIADLAIRPKRPFASGEFWEATSELERRVLAGPCHLDVYFSKYSIVFIQPAVAQKHLAVC